MGADAYKGESSDREKATWKMSVNVALMMVTVAEGAANRYQGHEQLISLLMNIYRYIYVHIGCIPSIENRYDFNVHP